MRIGRWWRRSALAASLAMTLPATAGCRWMPVRRPDPSAGDRVPLPEGAATNSEPIAVAPDLPSLPPLRSIGDEEAFRSPTPMLDAAAARDSAVKLAQATVVVDPPPSPLPAPAAVPEPTSTADEASEPEDAPIPEPERIVEPDVGKTASEEVIRPSDVDADAEDPWTAGLRRLKDVARENSRVGGPLAEGWANRERLLDILAEPGDSSPWSTVLSALATPADPPSPQEPPPAPTGPVLAISELRICKRVLGFGRTEPLASASCRPGQEVLLYCEIDGLRDEETPDGFRSRLSARVAIARASDGEAIWQSDLGEQEDVCRSHRRDFFANYRVKIPADLPAGEYEIRLAQKDLLADRETTRGLPVTVRP